MSGDFAKVKAAASILDVIGKYLHVERQGSGYVCLCPFHEDHRPSMNIAPHRGAGVWRCWACGAGGDVIDFVEAYERISRRDALSVVADLAGVELSGDDGRSSRFDVLKALEWAAKLFSWHLSRHPDIQRYVRSRGITDNSVEVYGLGYCDIAHGWLPLQGERHGVSPEVMKQAGLTTEVDGRSYSRFRGRLMFPIRDLLGRVVGFSARSMPQLEEQARNANRSIGKYINSPSSDVFDKSRTLYGVDVARHEARKRGWIVVAEGQIDVIALHQAGVPNVTATLGTSLTSSHVGELRRLADRTVLAFDGDRAGEAAARKALPLFLSHEIDLRIAPFPSGKDPADVAAENAEDARYIIETAEDPLGYLLARCPRDVSNPEAARLAIDDIAAVIAGIPATTPTIGIKIASAVSNLAERFRVNPSVVKRRINEIRRGVKAEPKPAPPDPSPKLDRYIVRCSLLHDGFACRLLTKMMLTDVADGPLRRILSVCYDACAVGKTSTFEAISESLTPQDRAYAASLVGEPIACSPDEVLYRVEQRLWKDGMDRIDQAIRESEDDSEKKALKDERIRMAAAKPPMPEVQLEDD